MKGFGTLDGQNLARGLYYAGRYLGLGIPGAWYRWCWPRWMVRLRSCEDPAVFRRAAYYNQAENGFDPGDDVAAFRLQPFGRRTAYQFDLHSGVRYFPSTYRVGYQFGDIRQVPELPMLVKSRPIEGDNRNAVLFKLNKIRHFYFVRDRLRFEDKRDKLVWRGRACQPHRKVFLAHYYEHPLCDVGHYHGRHQDVVWTKPRLTISEQLQYKFVLSIEGNDVATSLKWILSSRSLCFMRRPRFETWFMEGKLIPGRHYVQLRDDYSDLEEKIDYYCSHPVAAGEILDEANRWVMQFQNPLIERMTMLLVLWRYFYGSGQLAVPPPPGGGEEWQYEGDLATACG